jgi:hypothetical protein
MLLNYPALAVSLGIPNLQEHLRGSSRRKPTRSRVVCDVRRACAALLVEQGYSYRTIGFELRCHPSAISHFVRTHSALISSDSQYRHLVTQVRHVQSDQHHA